jgi:hypothetical protein
MSERPLREVSGAKGWSETTVFVCGSCSGNGKRMAKALRKEGRQRLGRRSLRVVRTGCLGLCPKHSVTLVVVRNGTSEPLATSPGADPVEVADALFEGLTRQAMRAAMPSRPGTAG